jgi:hypothetical protein
MAETLFGHLATHFAPSSENIAIEALGFILAHSPAARRAFTGVASAGGLALPPDLVFATQASAEDAARPDIEGYGSDLKRHIVAEAKFWAGLTINQPLTYAARLPTDVSAALVFIVPSARLTSLWSELTKRLKTGDYAVGGRREPKPELWHTTFGAGHTFTLVSWRAVLSAIQREMEAAQELDRLEDLRQLQGLCERMDSEAFLPFRSEELTAADVPQRYVQLAQLAYDLGEALIASGVCDSKRLTASGGMGYYGRYLRSGNVVFFSAFDSAAWHSHKLSPLWLRFDQYAPASVLDALRRGSIPLGETPAIVDRDKRMLVPLYINPGDERPAIVQSLAEQATMILAAIAAFAGSTAVPDTTTVSS